MMKSKNKTSIFRVRRAHTATLLLTVFSCLSYFVSVPGAYLALLIRGGYLANPMPPTWYMYPYMYDTTLSTFLGVYSFIALHILFIPVIWTLYEIIRKPFFYSRFRKGLTRVVVMLALFTLVLGFSDFGHDVYHWVMR